MSDPDGILATPLVTVPRDLTTDADAVPADIAEIARLVTDNEAVGVVVGLPVRLTGAEGPAAIDARAWADTLARAVAVPVVLSDERMSTVVATRRLAERGVRGRKQRAVVDQAAAVEILQSWLNAQRRQ
ncbi:putative Holliday junction resolvase [Spirilliplanes yamanashiensis]|nr:putative Holliday junction resolvase [Spirilliplanes yamanashiensis]